MAKGVILDRDSTYLQSLVQKFNCNTIFGFEFLVRKFKCFNLNFGDKKAIKLQLSDFWRENSNFFLLNFGDKIAKIMIFEF